MSSLFERLFKDLDRSDIEWAVGPVLVQKIERLIRTEPAVISDDHYVWSQLLFAVEGHNLLGNQRVRYLLLKCLPADMLASLAENFAKRVHSKPDDNALMLSHLKWRSRSPWMYELARILDLAVEYLPPAIDGNPTIEIVEPITTLLPLHPYQFELRTLLVEVLKKGTQRVLLQLPTGAGKTRTALESLVQLEEASHFFQNGQCVLWLAHSEELCEQAVEGFVEVWQGKGPYPVHVVRAWGGHSADVYEWRNSFVVSTFQSLYSLHQKQIEAFRTGANTAALVVVDEAHKVLAPTYRIVVGECAEAGATILGLTATPGRGLGRDRENEELADFFQRNMVAPFTGGNAIATLREQGYLSRLVRRTIESGLEISLTASDRRETTQDIPTKVLNRLADSVARNHLIIQTIKDEVFAGNACLVFACSVEHANVLSAVLNFEGCRSSAIDCKMNRAIRRAAISRFKDGRSDVLVNFGVLSTGFDAPRIKTVVITRPTSSVVLYSQMIGRGLRGMKMGGSETCNLIDIRDNFKNFGDVDAVYNCFSVYWE